MTDLKFARLFDCSALVRFQKKLFRVKIYDSVKKTVLTIPAFLPPQLLAARFQRQKKTASKKSQRFKP
ncbi:hypothetical protein [Pedobacter endophyticus]|uniref:Uncharacterized protein n=1 Tax=Pedobacter endophyticus TaxID=2789740 RepID=A0A7S9L097_9SPHI|nr:hypothetical protein [Pedobacter endophyticus]QPH40127.1 hypothetical protein IZT61_02245 [Pedobacter endophyticus]